MTFILKYFWLIVLLTYIPNFLILSERIKKIEGGLNSLAKEYLWGVLGIPMIPIIVMGIGMAFGNYKHIFYFFEINSSDLWIRMFYVSIIISWLIMILWVIKGKGAMLLLHYNTSIKKGVMSSENMIKLFYSISGVGMVLGFLFLTYITKGENFQEMLQNISNMK